MLLIVSCESSSFVYLSVSGGIYGVEVGTKVLIHNKFIGNVSDINYNSDASQFVLQIKLEGDHKVAKNAEYFVEDIDFYGNKSIKIIPIDTTTFLLPEDTVSMLFLAPVVNTDSINGELKLLKKALEREFQIEE